VAGAFGVPKSGGDPTFNDAPRRIAQERVPTNSAAFGEESLKTVCFDSFI